MWVEAYGVAGRRGRLDIADMPARPVDVPCHSLLRPSVLPDTSGHGALLSISISDTHSFTAR